MFGEEPTDVQYVSLHVSKICCVLLQSIHFNPDFIIKWMKTDETMENR